jgi:PAS domain S-box-containing protein
MLGLSRHLSIRLQLMGLFALVLAAGLAVLALDEAERRDNARVVDQLREESIQSLRLAKSMSDAYGLDYIGAAIRVRNELISWEEGLRIVDNAHERIERSWAQLSADQRTQRQREMLSRIRQVRGPADSAARKLRDILVRHDAIALGIFADSELFPAMDPVAKRLKALSDLQLIEADRRVRESAERAREASLTRLALTGAGLLLMGALASSMVRNIYRGVESLGELSTQMRKRDYETPPRFHPSGELGQVMDGFLEMRDAVRRFENELNGQLLRTEQVRASLQQSEVFQRSLLAAAQVAVISLDLAGEISSFNPFAEKLTGYGAEELMGQRGLEKMMLHEELERVAGQLSLALERNVSADARLLPLMVEVDMPAREWTLVRKDGNQVPVLVGTSAMRGEDGHLVGFLVVATDLTHIKQLEQRLRASELAAREASIAKSSFLAVMSHEIRTPMIGITGMLEVLSHSSLDGEQRRTIHVIQQSAASLLRIVGDILDFSKVEAGRIDLSPHTISLQDLLQSVLAGFAGSASSKGLVLRLQLDPRAAPAHVVDALRLRQVLSNFVSNAVKFTEQGSIELALERRAREGERELLRFRVTDTGIGVTTEQQARLFQPFSQAEGSTTRRFGGTGLGLVISQRLAELMGGTVSMTSEPFVGTTMVLELNLPIGKVEDLEPDASVGSVSAQFEPRPLPSVAQAEADHSLVLVVDDHPTNRLVIGRQLALAGYASESAEDGVAGLRAMRTGRFALVLSDVHMPVMDGYEMTRQWRLEEAGAGRERTPIVALTAAALAGEAERCLASGMDDYLAKPVTIPALAACVRKWLPHTIPLPLPLGDASAAAELPQARTPPAPLQPGVIEELSQGDRRLAAELMRDFLASTEADLAELDRTLAAGDAAGQARQAHRIGGSSRLVGAMELAEAARALELAARAADWTQLAPACAVVRTAAERLRLFVEAEYPAGAEFASNP